VMMVDAADGHAASEGELTESMVLSRPMTVVDADKEWQR
jgi:hypothetical protein